MKQFVIVVAGGSGNRMESEIPKQFLELKGKPIIAHTISKFQSVLPEAEIIVVIPSESKHYWDAICNKDFFNNVKTCTGGDSRMESVKNGLALIKENGIVGIHDAVRPLVSKETILASFNKAEKVGSAVPIMPLNDSIRRVFEGTNRTKDRSRYRLVQTPQCFQINLLKAAYNKIGSKIFSDDAGVFEYAGHKIGLVDGNEENLKITRPIDLDWANFLLSK